MHLAASSSPPAASPCAVRPGVSGLVRHPPAQPLDLPLQGFDLLRLDLANFFPSVREGAVKDCLLRLGARGELANAMVRLVTLRERLPQGAPTSVAVADIVLCRLDVRLAGMAERRGFTYTRYVDDITVSGGKRLARFEDLTRRIVTELGWELNEEKGSLVGPRQRHSLLGAVVNAKPNVSREYFDDVRSCLRRVVDGSGAT